jgi:dsDNA-specific endonuclease/ATPase MutS2
MLWLLAAVALLWGVVWLGRRVLDRPPREDPAPADPGGPDPDYDVHVGDELDLHGVPPAELPGLVEAFLEAARARGLLRVKIVHGKGIGVQRQRVRAILARHPHVLRFGDAEPGGSGWGATVAQLAPADGDIAPDSGSD